jgi:exodeoxyribonuclease VII large subunit
LERLDDRMRRATLLRTTEQASRLQSAVHRLHALSPLSVLARGYALVYTSGGALLRSANETSSGETIHARLSQGSLEARVTQTHTDTKPPENSTT